MYFVKFKNSYVHVFPDYFYVALDVCNICPCMDLGPNFKPLIHVAESLPVIITHHCFSLFAGFVLGFYSPARITTWCFYFHG